MQAIRQLFLFFFFFPFSYSFTPSLVVIVSIDVGTRRRSTLPTLTLTLTLTPRLHRRHVRTDGSMNPSSAFDPPPSSGCAFQLVHLFVLDAARLVPPPLRQLMVTSSFPHTHAHTHTRDSDYHLDSTLYPPLSSSLPRPLYRIGPRDQRPSFFFFC